MLIYNKTEEIAIDSKSHPQNPHMAKSNGPAQFVTSSFYHTLGNNKIYISMKLSSLLHHKG